MIGYIIKISILILTVMISLNIFMPVQAKRIVIYVSSITNIQEEILQENLNNVTQFTQDTFLEVSQKVQKNLAQ